MAQPQILEGTWEEIALHAAELRGKRIKLMVLPDEPQETSAPRPNEKMLQAMREAAEIQKGMRAVEPPSGLDAVSLVREARSGAMWGYEPSE